MKIRWSHDSIRLRITPGDLELILSGTPLTESIHVGGGTAWRMSVLPGDDATRLTAAPESGVTIHLSEADRATLARNDIEGVYFKDGEVRYFIEKDFPCEHPRPAEALEPNTETFVRP